MVEQILVQTNNVVDYLEQAIGGAKKTEGENA